MKPARVLALATAGLAVAAFSGVFQPSGARSAVPDAAGGLTVAGTGSANAVPDRASFSFGSVSQARTAAAALDESSQAAGRIADALRKAGVAKSDIQTSEISLSPRMNDTADTIVGYTACSSVTVVARKLADAGKLVDAAVAAGANHVYGPNLLVSDQDDAYRSALKAAVAEARENAEALASASGLTLGRITAIAETGGPTPLPATDAGRTMAAPIEPGTQRIDATVSVTFAIG